MQTMNNLDFDPSPAGLNNYNNVDPYTTTSETRRVVKLL